MVSGVMSTTRAAGDVVDDDRQVDRVVDRPVVGVEAFLGRLVVVGRHDQGGVGAGALGVAGQADRLLGRVRAGAGDHRHAPGRRPRCRARSPARARDGSGSGSRRWCRPARSRAYPRPGASPPDPGMPPRRARRCETASRAPQSSHGTCSSAFRIFRSELVECPHNRSEAGATSAARYGVMARPRPDRGVLRARWTARACGGQRSGRLAILTRCSAGCAARPRRRAADDDRSEPGRPMLEAADEGEWPWARHLAAEARRAAAARLCPLARAAREQGPAALRRLRGVSRRTAPTGRASARCRPAPRTRWTRSVPYDAARSRSSPAARRAPGRAGSSMPEALLASGPAARGDGAAARELGRGRFRRGPRSSSSSSSFGADLRPGGPRRPARPAAVGRPDRPGAADAAAGRPRRARDGATRACKLQHRRPGCRGGADALPAEAQARCRACSTIGCAGAASAATTPACARSCSARPTSCAGPTSGGTSRQARSATRSPSDSFKLAYRLASSQPAEGRDAASPRPNGTRAGWRCSSPASRKAARQHFERLWPAVSTPISQGRAGYWAGRAAAAAGDAGRGRRLVRARRGLSRTASTASWPRPRTRARPGDRDAAHRRRPRRPRATRCGAGRRPQLAAPLLPRRAGPPRPALLPPSRLRGRGRRRTSSRAVVELAAGLRPRRSRARRHARRRRQRHASGAGIVSRCRGSPASAATTTAWPSRRWCWPWPARRACSTRSRAARPGPWA